MDYKETFDKIKLLTDKYLLVKGYCLMVKGVSGYKMEDLTDDDIFETTSNYDEELILEAFNENIFEVESEGIYKFEALLTYSPEQVGNYPPPNIECYPYYYIDYIEFKFELSKKDFENSNIQAGGGLTIQNNLFNL